MEENNPSTWKDDLHHEAFNTDYYIIGTYQAKQWLGDMAFNVINHVKEYEQENFGEVVHSVGDKDTEAWSAMTEAGVSLLTKNKGI